MNIVNDQIQHYSTKPPLKPRVVKKHLQKVDLPVTVSFFHQKPAHQLAIIRYYSSLKAFLRNLSHYMTSFMNIPKDGPPNFSNPKTNSHLTRQTKFSFFTAGKKLQIRSAAQSKFNQRCFYQPLLLEQRNCW